MSSQLAHSGPYPRCVPVTHWYRSDDDDSPALPVNSYAPQTSIHNLVRISMIDWVCKLTIFGLLVSKCEFMIVLSVSHITCFKLVLKHFHPFCCTFVWKLTNAHIQHGSLSEPSADESRVQMSFFKQWIDFVFCRFREVKCKQVAKQLCNQRQMIWLLKLK